MYNSATKVALATFFATNTARLQLRKWKLTDTLYQEFLQLGYPITFKYFQNEATKYRKNNDIQLLRAENKYYKYKPRPNSV